jgi:D-aminopeptidase
VGALVVVNAVGDVVDASGRVVAGTGETGRPRTGTPGSGENTTLAVVATDAPLDRTDLGRLVRMAGTALARRIVPVHTPFDGDVVFAVSPTPVAEPVPSARLLELGVAARDALEEAILDAVAPHEDR